MADALTFEEFVTTRSPAFLRLAYALTRNHAHAEDLLQTALARSWPAWKRICGDPEPYVRRVLVNTHNSWWRRRWNAEHATDEMPEAPTGHPQSTVDDRDEVWRALARLPKRQRAVLVLRFFEDLSEAQIAETLSMAPGTVKSYAAKGLAHLRRDPSLLSVEIPPMPPGVERLTAVHERIKQRKRTRAVTIVAAIVALIALLIGSSPIARRQSLEPVGPGPGFPRYLDGHKIVAGGRFSFDQIRSGAAFTWTPWSWTASDFRKCAHREPDRWKTMVVIQINGHNFGGSSCDTDGQMSGHSRMTLTEEGLRAVGVELGMPVEVKVVLLEEGGPAAQEGTAAVAIGEPVPWDDFPFPERPKALEQLGRPEIGGFAPGARSLLAAGGAQVTTLEWGAYYQIDARSNTPGMLHVYVNDILVTTVEWWNYEAISTTTQFSWDQLGPAPAGKTTATLKVVPEHVTGDWYLVVKLWQ